MSLRLVFRALAALTIALTLSSCSNTPSKTSTLVPWIALAPVSTTTTTSTTTTLAPDPPCSAHQLRLSVGRGGAGLSNISSVIVITNDGSACRLSGYPDLFGSTATRPPGRLAVRKSGTYFGNLIPTDLSNGQRGRLLLGTDDACNALNEPSRAQDLANQRADTYHSVQVILPKNAGTLSPVKITFDTACGLDESRLGVQPPYPGEFSSPPGSVQSLLATVNMRNDVQSGTTLRYVVSLHNPDKKTVTWGHCPNYTESILTTPEVGGSSHFTWTYQLNCAQAKSVPPGHTITFVMRLPIGKTARSSEAKFSWQLDTGYGPYAGHAIYVFAAD